MLETYSLNELKTTVANSKIPLVLFLHAPWCGNCRSMYPVVEKFNSEYSGKIEFVKINVDNDKETAEFFKVEGVPTFVSCKKGRVIDIFSGANPTRLENMIKTL